MFGSKFEKFTDETKSKWKLQLNAETESSARSAGVVRGRYSEKEIKFIENVCYALSKTFNPSLRKTFF